MDKKKSIKLFAVLFIAAFAFTCVFATACSGWFGDGSNDESSGGGNGGTNLDEPEESDVYIYLESETVSVGGTGIARAYVKVTEEKPDDEVLLLDETQAENSEGETGENEDPEGETLGSDDSEDADVPRGDSPEGDEDDAGESEEDPEEEPGTEWVPYTGSCAWGTSDSSVAEISSNGDGTATIKGRSEGVAEILLTLKDGSGKTGSATVNVVDDSVSIYTDPGTVVVGGIATAYAEIEYEEGEEEYSGKYRWVSSDEGVLEVLGNGDSTAEIKGISEGTATITVTLDDNRKGSLTVDVGPDPDRVPEVESVEIKLDAETVTEGFEITATATVTMDVAGAEYEGSYEWTVEDDSILTVEGNEDNTATVTGVAAGETEITVTLDDGTRAEAYVTVTEKEPEVAGVEITFGGRQIQVGDEVTVTAAVTMDTEGAKYAGGFAWEVKSQTPVSGDGDVLSYNDNGDGTITVTAVSEGTAKVAVTLDGGEYAEAEISVFAKAPRPSDAVLTVSDEAGEEVAGYILAGDKVTISVSVTMDTDGVEYDGDYVWGVEQHPEVADETVVTFEENGDGTITLTGMADGVATVYVTLSDGSVWETEITVVVPRVEEITLSAEKTTILVGDELTIGVFVKMYPEDIEYEGGYTWSVAQYPDDGEEGTVSYTESSGETFTVTGATEGTAIVTVTLDDGSEKSIEITVTVPKVASVEITLSSDETPVETNEVKILDEFTATAVVTMDIDGKSYEGGLEWYAEDPAILQVTEEDGVVTVKAVGAGTGYLIAKTDDGREWRLEIFVLPAEIVKVEVTVTGEDGEDAESVEIGSTVTMTAVITMDVDGASYTGSYIWGSMTSAVIIISSSGNEVTVQGVSKGKDTVMLMLDDGSKWYTDISVTAPKEAYPVYAWFGGYGVETDEEGNEVTVVTEIDEILLDAYATTIEAPNLYAIMSVEGDDGETETVPVFMTYSENGYTAAGDGEKYTSKWTWTSSDASVAAVDEKTGKITIGTTGWATITADLGYGMTVSFRIGKKAIVMGTDPMIGTWTDTVTVSLFGMLDIWADVDITITGGAEATAKDGNTELFSLYIYNITTGTSLDELLAEFGFDLSEMNMTLFDQLPWYKIGDTYYVDVQDNAGTSYTVPVALETIDGWDYICLTFDATMSFWMGSGFGWWDIEVNIVDQKVARDRGHMHTYGDATWEWTLGDDGNYTVTVTWECVSDDCDKDDDYKVWTVAAVVTSEITCAATCEEDGLLTYTATYEIYGNTYSDTRTEIIPATGHSYPDLSSDSSKLEWHWDEAVLSADGTTGTVTVTLTCPSCGSVLTYTATFTVTVDTEATCTAEGSATYHGFVEISDTYNNGTFTDAHAGVVLEKIPHTFPEDTEGAVSAGYIVWEWDERDHGQQLVHLVVYCSACYGEAPYALIDTYVAYTETTNEGGDTKTLSATYSYGEYIYGSSVTVSVGKASVGSVENFLLALEENETGDLQITLTADITDSEEGDLLAALNKALEKASEPRQITINLNGYTLTLKGDASLAVGEGNALEISGFGGESATGGTLKLEQSLDEGAGNITVGKSGSLIITGATIEASASAIIVQGDATSVNISESKIIAGGTYGIATAAEGENGVTVILENAKIYAVSDETLMSTAVLIDVPSTVTITGGEIEGNYQGLVVRAGSVTVKETEISITGKYTGEATEGGVNLYTAGYSAEETWTNATPYAAVVIGNNTEGSGYAVTVVFDGVEISVGGAADAWAVYTYSSGAGCGVDFTVTNTTENGNAFTLVPSGIGTTVVDGTGPVYIGVSGDGYVTANEVKFVYSETGTSVEVKTATGLENALKMTGKYEITLTEGIVDTDGSVAEAFTAALSGTSASVTLNLGEYKLDLSGAAEDVTVGAASTLVMTDGTLVMNAGICVGEGAALEMSGVYVVSDGTAVTAGGTGSVVKITNSEITAATGIAINAGAVLTLSGSTINGTNQGLVVRGGEATVSDASITVATGNSSDAYANSDGTPKAEWTDGVPNAAIVLGNYGEGEAYKGETKAFFTGVTLAVAEGASDGTYFGLYVYSQSSECAVDVTIGEGCNFALEWLGLYDTAYGFKVYSGAAENGLVKVNENQIVEPYMAGVRLDTSEYRLDVGDEFVLTAIIEMSDGTTRQDTTLQYTWSYAGDAGNITYTESGNNVVIRATSAGLVTVTVSVGEFSGSCSVTLYLDPLIGTWVATDVDVTLSALGINASVVVNAGITVTKTGFDLWIVPTYIDGTLNTLLGLAESFLGDFDLSIGTPLTLFSNQGWRVDEDVENGYIIDADFEGEAVTIYATIGGDGRLSVPFDGALMGFIGLVFDATADKYDGAEATMRGVALSTTSYNLEIEAGKSTEYTITAIKTDGTTVTSGFTATSSDENVAYVSVNGAALTVTAVSGGTAVITISAAEASRTLVVKVPIDEPTVESVTFGNGAVIKTDAVSGTFDDAPKFTVTLLTGEAIAQEEYKGSVAWVSSDTSIATVDGEGTVTLTGKTGMVFVTVYIENCSAYYTLVVGAEEIADDDPIMGTWTGTETFEVSVTTLVIFTTDYKITAEIEITAVGSGFTFTVTFVEADSGSKTTTLGEVVTVWDCAEIFKIDGIYYVVNPEGTELVPITINDEGKLCMSFSLNVTLSEISYEGGLKFEISFNNANAVIVADATFGYGCIYATGATSGVVSEGLPSFSVTMSDGSVVSQAEYNGKTSWKSSDTSVATVDSYGNITLVGTGIATITVFVGDCSASYMIVVGYTEVSDFEELKGYWSSEDVSFEASVKGTLLTTKYTVTGNAELVIMDDGTVTLTLELTKAKKTIGSTTLTDEIVVLEKAQIFEDGDGVYYMVDPVTGNVFTFETGGSGIVVEITATIGIEEIEFEGEVTFSVTFTN